MRTTKQLLARLPQLAAVATLLGLVVILLVPKSREVVFTSSRLLVALDVRGLQEYLRGFEGTAWMWSSLLMVLQSLAAPIPALPITVANALIYGPWLGACVSFGSAQLAALLCFYLAQALGRPFVERLFTPRRVAQFDGFFARYGTLTVLVARLIPVVSFDAVSYAAGITGMRALPFFVATALGQLPATLIYSYAGDQLVESPSKALTAMFSFIGLAVLGLGLWWLRSRRRGDLATASNPPREPPGPS